MNNKKLINTCLVLVLILLLTVVVSMSYYQLVIVDMPLNRCIALQIISLLSLALFLCMVKCGYVAKKRIFVIIYNTIIVEFLLQVFAIAGILPGVSLYDHVPFGRVYWKSEGFSNSVMNRYGWYYPPLKLEPASKKIILIGDSFIESLQLPPQKNTGIIL